jgi:hypothetical protein
MINFKRFISEKYNMNSKNVVMWYSAGDPNHWLDEEQGFGIKTSFTELHEFLSEDDELSESEIAQCVQLLKAHSKVGVTVYSEGGGAVIKVPSSNRINWWDYDESTWHGDFSDPGGLWGDGGRGNPDDPEDDPEDDPTLAADYWKT